MNTPTLSGKRRETRREAIRSEVSIRMLEALQQIFGGQNPFISPM